MYINIFFHVCHFFVILELIAYASHEGSLNLAHLPSLTRALAAPTHKIGRKLKAQDKI